MTCSYRLRLISVYAGTILAGCLMVAADRTLNIISSCPSSITVYVNGESAGSLATGATVTKSVADDWSGFIYSNVNAPEGNTGAGTTKAGFVNQAGYYFIVKDTSNFNTGVSIVPSTSSSNGLCKRLTCHSKFCANSMTKQPTELPAPSNSSAPEPPLFSCALAQSFDVRFCPSNAFPRTGDTVTLHPGGSSNKCVNARGTAANGTVVDILDCDGSASQRWILNPGDTRAELAGTGYCLDAGSAPANRKPMKLWKCIDHLPAQSWTYNARSQLTLKSTNQCLDLTSGSTTNKNIIQTYSCSNRNSNQIWTVI